MANELKLCPFCGGKSKLTRVFWGHRFFEIECSYCRVRVSRETEEEVIDVWNRRVTDGE